MPVDIWSDARTWRPAPADRPSGVPIADLELAIAPRLPRGLAIRWRGVTVAAASTRAIGPALRAAGHPASWSLGLYEYLDSAAWRRHAATSRAAEYWSLLLAGRCPPVPDDKRVPEHRAEYEKACAQGLL